MPIRDYAAPQPSIFHTLNRDWTPSVADISSRRRLRMQNPTDVDPPLDAKQKPGTGLEGTPGIHLHPDSDPNLDPELKTDSDLNPESNRQTIEANVPAPHPPDSKALVAEKISQSDSDYYELDDRSSPSISSF